MIWHWNIVYFAGEQQPWAQPPKHVNLVQKVDPLISKPYKTYQLSRASSMETSSEKENIETGVSDKHRNSRAAVLANELIEGLNRATVKQQVNEWTSNVTQRKCLLSPRQLS